MGAELWTCHLGQVEYREALALQHRLRDARLAGEIPDVLLLMEHDPVYTRGRRSDRTDLPMGEEWHRMQGFDVVDADRGGKVTYHGPGQLVGYPIMAVRDVTGFVATLEAAVIAALADEGLAGRSRAAEGADYTGVWIEDRKIASIGLHVSRGVTTHGFAVNVDGDLQPFEWVVPCGLEGVRMTSVLKEHMGRHTVAYAEPDDRMGCFRKRMAYRFAEAAGRRQRLVSRARIDVQAPLLKSGNAPLRR
jgi:lipoyl(octanoyl) transferase